MAFPLGVHVVARTSPPTTGVPTATDTWFVVCDTDVGDAGEAIEVRDLSDFENKFGPRVAGNIELWDALDVFFREGGARSYVLRGTAADLDDFPSTLGPGQVSAIGETIDDTLLEALWAHALDHNRVVIGDVPGPTPGVVADLIALGEGVGDETDGRGGLFGPWVTVPGPSGVLGVTERQVPASPVIAALCSRVDATGNPNQAAAGRSYPLQYVTDLTVHYNDDDRADLLDAGVNTMADIYGVLENYGFQTTVEQQEGNPFWQLNCSRMRMALVGDSTAIGENYMFKQIDGRGLLANSLKGALEGQLLEYYNLGGLFGETPGDAFSVNVGASVNTIDKIAQGTLSAAAAVVLSLHAKAVEIALVTVPIGGTV